jgi:nucleoside-diphosphate-sugar epimerase
MRVLIVGCGYIGLPLGTELRKVGHEVFGLRRSLAAAPELRAAGIQPLHGDICEPTDLARLPAAYDWVINSVSASGGGVEEYRAVYLEGTRNLIAWLTPNPPKKFVYTSSTSVYGQNDGSIVSEESPTQPEAETAKVLVETEQLLLGAARKKQFPAIILRLAGIYGPDRGYWFKQFIRGAAKIEGDGQRFLNMIHRDDVAGAVIAALERGQPGGIYNVVDDEPVTQLDLFRWLAATLEKPLPQSAPVQPGELRKRGSTNKRVSDYKLRTELSYQLKYPTYREGFPPWRKFHKEP